jgi:hypothetical protein
MKSRIEFRALGLPGCDIFDVLPDTIRHLYTDPAEFIDGDHPAVEDLAKSAVGANAGERVPAKFLMREMARDYANLLGEDLTGRDTEREAAEG